MTRMYMYAMHMCHFSENCELYKSHVHKSSYILQRFFMFPSISLLYIRYKIPRPNCFPLSSKPLSRTLEMFSALLAPSTLPLVLIFLSVQVRARGYDKNSSYILTIGFTNGCTSTIFIHRFILLFLSDNSILWKTLLYPLVRRTLHSSARKTVNANLYSFFLNVR